MHKDNCFITLTYNEENAPHRNNLNYRDFQLFMKRLRKRTAKTDVRFYMGAEYGEKNGRPHFHACIFGWDWPDKKLLATTPTGNKIYRSAMLEELWPYGYSSSAEVTFQSAAYIARYCMKKVTGDAAKTHYKRTDENGDYWLTPEFNKMSNRPGIGAKWLDKYKNDVYNHDHVIINGMEITPPKYYDKLLKRQDPDKLAKHQENREIRGAATRHDNTPERLEAKRIVAEAKIKNLKRGKV